MPDTTKQPTLALWLIAPLIVILPIEGTAALRNVLLFSVLIVFGIHVWKTNTSCQLAFPLRRLWAAYAGIAALNLIWAVDISYSLNEIKHEILFGALFFWLAFNAFQYRNAARWLISGILTGNIFLVGYALFTWTQGGTTKDGLVGTFHTGVGNFTTYLVTVAPLLAWLTIERFKSKNNVQGWFLLFLLGSNLAAMYATQNRQGFVSIFVELLVVLLLARKVLTNRLVIGSIAVMASIIVLLTLQMVNRAEQRTNVADSIVHSTQTDTRLPIWKFAISESLNHPLSGGGMGRETYKHLYPDHPMTYSVFVHTHNVLINRLVQLGLPGALLFLTLFSSIAFLIWEQRHHSKRSYDLALVGVAICLGTLVKNLTDDFFMRELGYFYWLLGGAILGIQQSLKVDINGHNRFLIIRRDNIGDLLCTTPMIHALRSKYPTARIDVLVNSYNAPVLSNNPDLNHVYAYTKAKHRAPGETVLGVHWRRIKLMWQLRQTHYDVVILAGDGNIDRQLGLARWLKAARVIGFDPADGQAKKGLTTMVPKPETGHEVERTFLLLVPLGITGKPPKMVLVPMVAEVSKATTALGVVKGSQTIAVHISARKIPQRWAVERFAETMQQIHTATGARFMLFWSPGDENNPLHPGDDRKAQQLLSLTKDLPICAYPTHELSELVAGLSLCQAMICADGGAMHIGAALGLPTVALFGNSDASRWYPWQVPHSVLQTPDRDVGSLGVQDVARAFLELNRNT